MQGASNFSDDGYLADLKINAWVNFLSFTSWKIKEGFFSQRARLEDLSLYFL